MNKEAEPLNFRIDSNADGTVTITTGAPSITGTVEDVEAIIQALATVRAQHPIQLSIDPPWLVPGEFHQRVEANTDPRFFVQRTAMQDSVLLSLRHPGYGWLPFQIPNEHVQTLIQLLQQNLDAPQSSGRA